LADGLNVNLIVARKISLLFCFSFVAYKNYFGLAYSVSKPLALLINRVLSRFVGGYLLSSIIRFFSCSMVDEMLMETSIYCRAPKKVLILRVIVLVILKSGVYTMKLVLASFTVTILGSFESSSAGCYLNKRYSTCIL
jgi:hypothetical protein